MPFIYENSEFKSGSGVMALYQQPTDIFHRGRSSSQGLPHHTHDNSWIWEVLFYFVKDQNFAENHHDTGLS